MHSMYSLRIVFCGVVIAALSGCPSADPGSRTGSDAVLQETVITANTTIDPGTYLANSDIVVSPNVVGSGTTVTDSRRMARGVPVSLLSTS